MSDTTGAIRSAEFILRQAMRDADRAALIGEHGLNTPDAPFAWQGNVVRGAEVAKSWRQEGRQTLAIHPGLVDEIRMASSSTFPLELLRAIPYLNPMVVYSEPPVLRSWRANDLPERWLAYTESSMRVVGFFVSGSRRFNDRRERRGYATQAEAIATVKADVVSTHDPDAEAVGMVVFFEILDRLGRSIDVEVASFSVPLEGAATFADLVDAQVERFAFTSERDMTVGKETWIREVYGIILGTLLYLCSTTLETEKVPVRATRHLTHSFARKPLNLYRVGWTLGSALSRYRREREASGPGSRRGMQDPQHRKCHFRMQWFGPRGAKPCQQMRGTCPCEGRHREWIFIAPYWTHRELLGDEGVTTVRAVL